MVDGRCSEQGVYIDLRIPQVEDDFAEFRPIRVVAEGDAVAELSIRVKRSPLNAVVRSLIPIVHVQRRELSQPRPCRRVIRERAEVHFNLPAQREVAAGLSTVGEQIVESANVSGL